MSARKAKKKKAVRGAPKPETVAEATGHLERMRLKFEEAPIHAIAAGVEQYRAKNGALSPLTLRLLLAIHCRFVHTLQLKELEDLLESGSQIGRGVFWGLTGIKLPRGREARRKLLREWHADEEKLLADPK